MSRSNSYIKLQNADGTPVDSTNPLPVDATLEGDVNVDAISVNTSGLIGKASGTNGDFVVAYASGTTITFSGLPTYVATLTADDIETLRQIDNTGAVVETYTRNDTTFSITGSTITVGGATFAATDTFVLFTNIDRQSSVASTGSTSSVMIGSEIGSYTFDASAQTITLSGIRTLKIEEILLITNITDQEVIYNPGDSAKGGTISSNVITLEFDTTSMDDTDDLQIYVQYDNSEDYDQSVKKTSKQNQNDFTSTEHVIDSTNDDTTTVRTIIPWEGYRNGTFHFKCSGGVTITVWASNDSTADDSADTGWVDVGEDWLQLPAGGLVDDENIYALDTSIMPDRFMIKHVTSDATNATDAWINKHNPF